MWCSIKPTSTVIFLSKSGHKESDDVENLTRLYLEINHITAKGVAHLANSPYLKNLVLLSLDRNKITDDGFYAIGESEHLLKLEVPEFEREEEEEVIDDDDEYEK